jgi:hypothetical protein
MLGFLDFSEMAGSVFGWAMRFYKVDGLEVWRGETLG